MLSPIDTNMVLGSYSGDGFIGLEEYRYDCVNRQAVTNIKDLDKAFKKISENGGITR